MSIQKMKYISPMGMKAKRSKIGIIRPSPLTIDKCWCVKARAVWLVPLRSPPAIALTCGQVPQMRAPSGTHLMRLSAAPHLAPKAANPFLVDTVILKHDTDNGGRHIPLWTFNQE